MVLLVAGFLGLTGGLVLPNFVTYHYIALAIGGVALLAYPTNHY